MAIEKAGESPAATRTAPVPKRQLPISQGQKAAATLVGEGVRASQAGDDGKKKLTVASAALTGFIGGFADRMRQGAQESETRSEPEGEKHPEQEDTEQSADQPPARAAHLDRFPELENVRLATGAAARFPELAEETAPAANQQAVGPATKDEGIER